MSYTDGTVFEYDALSAAVWLTVEIGALNWGLTEFADYNVVAEVIPTDLQAVVYGVIALAAVIALSDSVGIIDDLTELVE